MVDKMEAKTKSKSPKFNPKFEASPDKKKASKKKLDGGEKPPSDSPAKKKKTEAGGKFEKKAMLKKPMSDEKKKKILAKVNKENDADKKSKKKPKGNANTIPLDKNKQKFSKAGNPISDKQKSFDGKKVLLNKQDTRKKQKEMKEVRKKFKLEDAFDIGVKAKKVWEEVRREDCPEDKKDKLLKELHSLVKGNIKKIIYSHDTVRVVECLMALGNEEIRDNLFEEMKGEIIEMAKSKYAHFFVMKMLRYGTKAQKQIIVKEMEGKMAKLMKNKTAGNVVEIIYNDVANGPQRNSMLQEFLDNEFLVFKDPELRTVPDIIAKYPDRADNIKQQLHSNVETLIRKGCYNHSLVHTVLYNYMQVAEPKQRAEIIEQMKDSLQHMVHTREGAYAALYCVWHGTTKDRRAMIKSFKTLVVKTAQEEYGHMFLLGLLDSVDDTKVVGKAVIGELMEDLTILFDNKYGVRVLKYLFGRRDSTYFNKDHTAILEKGDGNEHSKKDVNVRHNELLAVAAPPVLTYITERFPGNLYDAGTSITLTCILNHSPPSSQLEKAFDKLASQICKPFSVVDAAPNLVENVASNMLFKKLIAKDADRKKVEGAVTFSSVLMPHLDDDALESWLNCNRGCLLLLTILNLEDQELTNVLKTKLKSFKTLLKKLTTKSAELLREKLGA